MKKKTLKGRGRIKFLEKKNMEGKGAFGQGRGGEPEIGGSPIENYGRGSFCRGSCWEGEA